MMKLNIGGFGSLSKVQVFGYLGKYALLSFFHDGKVTALFLAPFQ
jgi:hypothetical protein